MASTQCLLHHHALTTPTRNSPQRQIVSTKPNQIVCKAQQKQEDVSVVSRRLALTVLIGAAAVGSKVSPADAAYGEAGMTKTNCTCLIFSWEVVNVRLNLK